MKRLVTAQTSYQPKNEWKLMLDFIDDNKISKSDVLNHFVDELMLEDVERILKSYIELCDLEDEYNEWKEYASEKSY